ncbi:MAG: hypothetical protein MR823_06905 [Ruminococcus sp.]|nr:hypothetical protein [Ruminococcus sp.]MDY4908979.1 hypothetical protein [Candidatus Fimenecus sp.]
MAKNKPVLTPEELEAKNARKEEKRKIFGETFFKSLAVLMSIVLVYSIVYIAFGQGTTIEQKVVTQGTSNTGNGGAAQGGSSTGGNTVGGATSNTGTSSDAPASDASEAKTVADALNSATKAVVDSKAGYDWARKCEYTTPIDVGNATDTLNKVIHMVDKNADLNSVVGGFLGVGDKKLTIKKGEDAAAAIDYHGTNYALKATSLKPEDLKGLKVDGDSFEFTLDNVTTPAKDGSNSLSRFTNDIITKDEVEAEIKAQVQVVTVNSLDGEYTNIKVKGTITDGKLVSLEYETSTSAKLALKALGIGINGSGAIHTTASYKNFVY